MNKLNWSNIPIPEGHMTLLLVGVILHFWRPLRLSRSASPRHLLGWPLLLTGVGLVAWAVSAVKSIDIEKPNKLVIAGSYAISRNPMYLAWTIIYLAIAVLANTLWLIILLPVLILFTHYFVVLQEERQLEQQFGKQYRARVRRYL